MAWEFNEVPPHPCGPTDSRMSFMVFHLSSIAEGLRNNVTYKQGAPANGWLDWMRKVAPGVYIWRHGGTYSATHI